MSSYCLGQDLHFPLNLDEMPPSCHIRGRMIPYGEFLPRLNNYCLSLGFREPVVTIPQPSKQPKTSVDHAVLFEDESGAGRRGQDSVIILSARVPYEPSWGVYNGLPRPLIHEAADCRPDGTISNFIAPYLRQYRYAQRHVYLTCHETQDTTEYLLVLPSDLLHRGEKSDGRKLRILPERIAEPDERGDFVCHNVSDTFVSFPLSAQFVRLLDEKGLSWKAGKTRRIDDFLTADLFVFEDVPQAVDCRDNRGDGQNPYVKTLLPFMNRIVTDANPQLLAATLYLQSEFIRTIDDILHAHDSEDSVNLLCIAGLDIDAAMLGGSAEHYFVPWTAVLQRGGDDDLIDQVDQDDLFVALMAQEKQ